jgi:hypothetical protein
MSTMRTFLCGATTMAAALAAIMTLTGAKGDPLHSHFDEITVGRINIVEPDGSKRLIISNRAQFPGDFEQGAEGARPDRRSFAGMLFIDEEGNENGGLIQKGSKDAKGKINAGVSLTFDRYRQDQALQLLHNSNGDAITTRIDINDVPHHEKASVKAVFDFEKEANKLPKAERDAYWKRLSEEGYLSNNRIRLGMTPGNSSALTLKDAKGKTRMMLMVSPEGEPVIQMFNDTGKVVKQISIDKVTQ